MLQGDLVVLTALDPANSETVRAWLGDPQVNRWMLVGHVPLSAAGERAFYEQAERDHARGSAYHLEIHAREDMRLLGVCGLADISHIDRHGEVGIFIGDPAQHGKGYGRDALVTLARFAFHVLGLNTLRIRAIAPNENALGLYRSVGFSDAGTYREARYAHGRFHNVVLLDMTRLEFDSLYAE